ncbi:MAG TPA: rhodanese-like domain-containing protein [Desulfosporosinus sp.]|nr:rhodanese-like domain-containing protein [Desulfosporosinus sp.]
MKRKTISWLVVLALAAFTVTGCSQATTKVGTSPSGSEVAIEKASMKLMKDTEVGGYKLVSTEELNKWMGEKKDMIILDTMPADNFAKGRIPGALNAELPKTVLADATAEQKSAFIKLLGTDKNKTIVVYCGFVGCARSDVGAAIAVKEGFTNVYRVPGGSVAWGEAKYTVEK